MSNGTIHICKNGHHICGNNIENLENGRGECWCGARIIAEAHKSSEPLNDVAAHMIERRKKEKFHE